MSLVCTVCEHEHLEDGTCECGCEAEKQMDELCWSCAHPVHHNKPCQCGCDG